MQRTCVWVGAAIFLATTTYAQHNNQTGDSVGTTILNDVVITANKFQQKQSQTGKVVSVITKEELNKSVGLTLGQLLNQQAGITIPGALNALGSPQTLSVRGAASGRTLVLVDGIPAYDPSLINSEFDLNLMSLNNIERIEIARGAQSTLYGSDAEGGVVNLITKDPNVQKPFNVKATAAFGTLNTFRGNLQLYGKSGKMDYSARYARLSSDGFSAAHDQQGNGGFDDDGYKGDNFGATVHYSLNGHWSLKAFVQRNLYKADVDAGVFADDKDYTIDNKNTMAGAGFLFKRNKLTLTGNYQYSDNDRFYLNDSGHVSGFSNYSTDKYFGRNQFFELYGNLDLGHGLKALAGVDYRFSNMNSQYHSESSWGPYSSKFSDTSVFQSALYGSLIYTTGALNLEAGGRLNVHEEYGTNATFTFNPSYQLTKKLRVFGSIASGFKAPTLYQLYGNSGNTSLSPERATTFEAGLQQNARNLTNRLVYFYRNIDNAIDFDYINYRYYNISKQKVHGLEWESDLKLNNWLALHGNYTLLLGEENVQSRVSTKDTIYHYLLRRPKHNVNITAGFSFSEKLQAALSGKYVSERYDAGGYQVADVKMPGYFIMNAYVSYDFKPWFRLFADVQNLLDNEFYDLWGYNSIPFLINGGITLQL